MIAFLDEVIIGFEFKNFLIAVFVLYVIYLAWESTNVREDYLAPRTVLIIENNRRRLISTIVRDSTAATNNIPFQEVTNGSSRAPNVSGRSETVRDSSAALPTPSTSAAALEQIQLPEPPPSLQAVIDEVNDLATVRQQRSEDTYRALESLEQDITDMLEQSDTGPQHIIRAMDNTADTREGLRIRRLGTAQTTDTTRDSLNVQVGADTTDSSAHAENCSNENNENESISAAETNKIIDSGSAPDSPASDEEEFRIKLRYLNDETRLVKGSPTEIIGDFKKRHFTVEMGANKMVRLVFNGHILQPDTKTLRAFGLFDNCVVHCLIHAKAAQPASNRPNEAAAGDRSENRSTQGQGIQDAMDSDAQPARGGLAYRVVNGPMLLYIGAVGILVSLILCWIFRIQYNHLFTWYSTIGLILMSVMFIVVLSIIILMERDMTT